MSHDGSRTDLDELLREAAPRPLPQHRQDDVFADTWHTLTTTQAERHDTDLASRRARRLEVVATQQTRARRHRRLVRVSAITVTVALAGAGTAAAATYLAARTGAPDQRLADQRRRPWRAPAPGRHRLPRRRRPAHRGHPLPI